MNSFFFGRWYAVVSNCDPGSYCGMTTGFGLDRVRDVIVSVPALDSERELVDIG